MKDVQVLSVVSKTRVGVFLFLKECCFRVIINPKTNPKTASLKKKKKKRNPGPQRGPDPRVVLTTPSVVQTWEGNDIGPALIC